MASWSAAVARTCRRASIPEHQQRRAHGREQRVAEGPQPLGDQLGLGLGQAGLREDGAHLRVAQREQLEDEHQAAHEQGARQGGGEGVGQVPALAGPEGALAGGARPVAVALLEYQGHEQLLELDAHRQRHHLPERGGDEQPEPHHEGRLVEAQHEREGEEQSSQQIGGLGAHEGELPGQHLQAHEALARGLPGARAEGLAQQRGADHQGQADARHQEDGREQVEQAPGNLLGRQCERHPDEPGGEGRGGKEPRQGGEEDPAEEPWRNDRLRGRAVHEAWPFSQRERADERGAGRSRGACLDASRSPRC
jgi:hypothetical protein